MDQTYIEVIRNFLDSHVDDVLAWYAAKMQHMTSLEPEDFDDRTDYLLANKTYEGISKLVKIKPQEFVERIADLDKEVRQLCIQAAEEAQRQAQIAYQKGNTAESQGNTAETKGNTAQAQGNTAQQKGNTAESQGNVAEQKGNAAATATVGAEKVNASLSGYTVTVTDRTGTSRSVDIGFEMYRTYETVAAMNADAANVPQGKFVIIATTDKTSTDNAKMYCKNSQGSFTFLCDLDQASSEAWAEWLNTQKPLIEAATALANTKAQYAETQGDRAKGYNDHPWEIRQDGYIWVWDEASQRMSKTNKMIISFDELTEEQKEELIRTFYESLVFASQQTCMDIIDELQ